MAAIRLQERRFTRLAERYAESLREADPAALALLQRVCLFRLGVDAATLASIFTGEGKEEVAGPELAALDEAGIQSRLALLTEMKLLDREEDQRYTVHPAVRDGFLKNLDEETSRRGHEAAREGLEVSLGDRQGINPSDPATLDLLEEIVHHTLAAGDAEEAWDILQGRIGGSLLGCAGAGAPGAGSASTAGRSLVVRQPSFDGSWRSFTPLAALLLLDVVPATPASERLASDAKSSPDTPVKRGLTDH